ncbi:MAG: protein phosphatase 2C domain-containing protein [Bacillota bacterium]
MPTGFVIGDRGLGASGDTHPAWIMAHAVAGPYLVVGASALGQIHLALGTPRDDAFVVRAAGPWLAVAVADGVGSRPLSRYGATYVAEALSASLLRPLVPIPRAAGTPNPQFVSPERSILAPPPRAENVELRVGVATIKPGVISLVAGLRDWTRRVNREEPRSPDGFPQAASIGWWPHDAPTRSSLVPATHLPQDPMQAGVNLDKELPEPPAEMPHDFKGDLIELVKQAYLKTHLGLREHARSLGLDLADLGCTALALLLNVETGRGAVGQVGDGAILGLTAQGRVLELVEAPDTGDPQATYTLNNPYFERYLAPGVIDRPMADPFVAFYVMTDGLSGDLLYSPKPDALEDWAQKVDHNLRASPSPAQAAAGMLNWLATYVVKGSWDDRTLVVITQKERTDGDRQPVTQQPRVTQ